MSNIPAISQIAELTKTFENSSAEEILKWSFDTFGKSIALASSFGAEDVVLIDMMTKIDKQNTRVFSLDTGRLNEETYIVMDSIRLKYEIPIEVYFPDAKEVEEMVNSKGMNLMYNSIEDRKQCCQIRKVHPLNRALKSLDAWITGLRRDQAITRAAIDKIEIDTAHNNIFKINPLADWNSEMIWDYIRKNDVPYNQLHNSGYPSIGCAPCTRKVQPGDDPRSGRWWWEDKTHKECGLHIKFDNKKNIERIN